MDGKVIFKGSADCCGCRSHIDQIALDGHTGQLSMLMSAAVVLKCGPSLQCLALGSQLYVDDVRLVSLQVWDMKTNKLKVELPGHSDEVFSVDWSPDGGSVASGGRDKVLKLWRH